MLFRREAEAAIIMDFCVTDFIAQQQMVMLFWWNNTRMQQVMEARKKAKARRWWVKPWRNYQHEVESG